MWRKVARTRARGEITAQEKKDLEDEIVKAFEEHKLLTQSIKN